MASTSAAISWLVRSLSLGRGPGRVMLGVGTTSDLIVRERMDPTREVSQLKCRSVLAAPPPVRQER